MNTLLESTTCENLKSSGNWMRTGNERHADYEYAHSSRGSFVTTSAVAETTLSRGSALVKRRPLAPSKPPMRLGGNSPA